MEQTTIGTLKEGEYHPSANNALQYIHSINPYDLMQYQESMASCAIEGNRLGEICSETLERIFKGLPVSDRYLLGLAWFIKEMEEKKQEHNEDKL